MPPNTQFQEDQITIRKLREENAKLRAALSWMADQDPQLVDAAREKFGINEQLITKSD